jgi:hypothetical protein
VKKESVIEIVRQMVEQIPVAQSFGFADFGDLATIRRRALSRALRQMVKDKEIRRAYPGRFYRPRASDRFGPMDLFGRELLREALDVGYPAGSWAHNDLGLSTQVPMVLTIATPSWTHERRFGYQKVRYIRSTIKEISKVHAARLALMILDALKEIRHVSDSSPNHVVNQLFLLFKQHVTIEHLGYLLKYGLQYPPQVRALLGAIFEIEKHLHLSEMLRKTLNPRTEYFVGVDKALPNFKKWKLVGPGRTNRAWERRWKKRRNEAQKFEP